MLEKLRHIIPDRIFFRAGHALERRRFHRGLRRYFGNRVQPTPPGPMVPAPLIAKTAALDEQALERETNPDVYFAGGYHVAANFLDILGHHAFDFASVGSIFELGCGTARLLRHFRCVADTQLHGSDVNPEMIAWCRENISGVEFHVNELEPPLSFAEDGAFDLVLALSVFTHIPIEWQQAWLEEIARVMRPDGLFLCTVSGENHKQIQLGSDERKELREKGHLTLNADHSKASLSTRVGGSNWDVFQTREEIERSFGAVFRIIDHIPGGQDLLVLQKHGPQPLATGRPYPGQAFLSLE